MSALVKVIVPCYGYGDLLEGCLASVTSQEGVDVRVLVVDDCSPDDTAAVATRLAAADERIEFLRNAENKGLIGTANAGLDWAADSDYVVLLSADDFLTPGCLARAVGVMERNPAVGLVYGRPQFFEPDGEQAAEPGPSPRPESARWRGTKVWSGKRWIELRCRTAHNCIASPEAVVRTSVQRQVGDYDPACYHTSDLNMWLRIAAVADVAHVRGATQAMYRIHADSMLRSDADPMVDLRERRNGFERFFADAGSAIAGRTGMQRTVRRTLARQALWQASRAYDRGETDGPGAAPVSELIEFALETCPEARHLREWAGLRLRRKIGAGRSLLFVPFLATGAGHRVRGHLGQLRWRLSGV
jgi:glycosyltransferase involved in cell wall biosynthesis